MNRVNEVDKMSRARYAHQRLGIGLWQLFLLTLCINLTSCGSLGLGSSAPNLARYDFGPETKIFQTRIPVSLKLTDVTAPVWLDSSEIYYRLQYSDVAQLRAYTESRWVASPPAMLGKRLRYQLGLASENGITVTTDAVKAGCTLRIELLDFIQIFDTSTSSRVHIAARISLIGNEDRLLLAQKVFDQEQVAPSADARGGVAALTSASNEMIKSLLSWLQTHLDVTNPEGKKNYQRCK